MDHAFQPTAFARRHLRHQMQWRVRGEHGDHAMHVSPMWDHWLDGVHPAVREAAEGVAQGLRLHSHAAALNSSMVFGFNLLLPFRSTTEPLSAVLSAVLGEPFKVEQLLEFEWAPPADVLAELRGDAPEGDEPFTAIDALAIGRAGSLRAAVLIEVKLTEGGFTKCRGYESRGNQRRDICESAAMFVEDPDACYLRRPKRAVR